MLLGRDCELWDNHTSTDGCQGCRWPENPHLLPYRQARQRDSTVAAMQRVYYRGPLGNATRIRVFRTRNSCGESCTNQGITSAPTLQQLANYYFQTFPLPLDELLALSDRVQMFSAETDGMITCHGCNKQLTFLMKCAKCSLFWYCNGVR